MGMTRIAAPGSGGQAGPGRRRAGAVLAACSGLAWWLLTRGVDSPDWDACRSLAFGAASADGRFRAIPRGVLDSRTGLTWAACDSGVGREVVAGDADHGEARAHCAGLGQGWTLPTPDQLEDLHGAQQQGGSPLHGTGGQMPVLVRLSPQARWYWTDARAGADRLAVNLWDGTVGGFPAHARFNMRALCVQAPAPG